MRKRTQLWIGVSNREESMARVLSRANFHEGTVLHAHRAASSSLIAVLEENGRGHTSGRCADLCSALEAHGVVAAGGVLRAAQALDRRVAQFHLDSTGGAPARSCDAKAAANSLDHARLIRGFVNTVLTK